MLKRLINPTYNYAGYDVVNLSATFQVLKDDGVSVIAETAVSASYNLGQADFIAEVERQILTQIQEYMTKLLYLDTLRAQVVPSSTDFDSAVQIIMADIEAKL